MNQNVFITNIRTAVQETSRLSTTRSVEQGVIELNLVSYISSLSGLVFYYPMNEKEGFSVLDHGNNAHTGFCENIIFNQEGKCGTSVFFNGQNSKIVVQDDPGLRGLSSFTIAFFLCPLPTTAYRKIIRSHCFDIGINNEGKIFCEFIGLSNGNCGIWNNQGAGVSDKTWRAFFVVYTGSIIRLYINAFLVQSQSASGSLSNNSQNLVLGNANSEWFLGNMQHVFLLDRPATQQEIEHIVTLAGF